MRLMVLDVWGLNATANAPLLDITRFCAHHHEEAEVIIYLDRPDVEVIALSSLRPKVIPTDNAY